ncbi:DNA alkylation repair protein [Chryseobacterium elymi]|uniref:DNA alkylation repair protein n=1 Tax=Chryseobacterium elymi TaxID=395936 RepID=A0A3D9DDK1_9FLAO|nr:DNA alkylation repair protein [Chryseobacterium elymi]REC76038.1 DNA alkylation repair protein [Chryseobacterium elymi]
MTEKRKGARSIKDIPDDILEKLNQGKIESVNLTEWLAVDQKQLLENFLLQQNRKEYLEPILKDVSNLKKQTVNTINEAIGLGIFNEVLKNNDDEFLPIVSGHTSDLVRCWGTYMVGRNNALTIKEKLEKIQQFASDGHFGVREICWMAVRSEIADDLEESLFILSEWTDHEDEYIRRFASESTRPRGVWCAHIEKLKENPALGLEILEPMKSDSSRYVQDSVGNWLNDASKSCPEFVTKTCERWLRESPTKETMYIIKKALRTIQKDRN